MTPAETILWQRLRNKQLAGWKFRRQEPIGPHIADFFCFESQLVIELDGISHNGHLERDAQKDSYLKSLGIETLRFENREIYRTLNGVLEKIDAVCSARKNPTQPPPAGEEFIGQVVLVGFMGCGKSSVARALAALLKCEAVDLDHCIEAREGQSIAQIFSARGEDEFRRLETSVLNAALQDTNTPRIIATGGGIVTRAENRALLKAAAMRGVLVVYLQVAPEVLAARIRRQPGIRPLIDGARVLDMEQTRLRVEALLKERAPHYQDVANFVVDGTTLAPDEIAHRIADQISIHRSSLIVKGSHGS